MGISKVFPNISSCLLLCSIILSLLSSCVTSNLQTAAVKGLETKSAAHLAKDNYKSKFSLKPYFFKAVDQNVRLNTGTHTLVNGDGIYELEPTDDQDFFIEHRNVNKFDFSGKNLIWQLPSIHAGMDMEYCVNSMILTLGLQYGSVDNQDFLNGIAGLSFFMEKRVRIGFNVYFKSIYHEVVVLDIEDKYSKDMRDVRINQVEGSRDFVDYEFYLNWRSDFQKEVLLDIFMEGAFGRQALVDVTDDAKNGVLFGEQDNMYYDDFFKTLTLGVFKNISKNSKLIAGYKMNFHDEEYTNSFTRSNSFFLQYEVDFIPGE